MPDSIRRNERNLACLAGKETARKETGIKCRATTKKEPDASALGSRFSAVKNEQWHSLLWRLRMAHKGAELFDGPLFFEPWDWIVVMQCMQDHGYFMPTKERQPYRSFVEWLKQIPLPGNMQKCSAKTLSRIHIELNGARYPWNEVKWKAHVHVHERWCAMYKIFDKMLCELEMSGQ